MLKNHSTYDYTWSQFIEMRNMNRLMDELYKELDRRNNTICKKCEQAEDEDNCETGDYETGDYETGDYETGDCETDDYETGGHEIGDYEIDDDD